MSEATQNPAVAAAVAAIAAGKAPDTITMNDGRLVEFPPKRKLQKESFVETDVDGLTVVRTRLDFRNGETRLFTIPDNLLHKFAGHGAEQKLGDAIASLQSVDDGVMAVDELIDRLYQGEWNAAREASGLAGASDLAKALAELKGQPIEKVKDFLKGKSNAERTALKNVPAVKAIIDRIEGEKLAKAGSVDTTALLAGLE